jgi:carboxypeptidase PM20D1
MIKKLGWLLLAALLVLVAALAVNTLTTRSRQLAVPPVVPAVVDGEGAARRLAAAVTLRTESAASVAQPNAAQFDALHALLQASYPKLHAVLKREVVGGHSLLYSWAGSDAQARPIALMAHQDVVPIAPGTEGDWTQAPYSGALADGFVWGRGAWDDKGNLVAIMEAVEALVASGFTPRQTVYLVFGHDEEVGGEQGARAIAALLKSRGVKLQFALDEGLLITDGMLPGLTVPAALVGVAEKGYMSLQLTASATPGHSSMPPTQAGQSAIGMMSAALARLEERPVPGGVRGVAKDMFDTLAPEMNGLNRVLLSNLWLFKPVVESQLLKAASTNALLRTTTALTVIHAGNKDNVLPGRAEATVNFRLLPGDGSEQVVAHAAQALGNPGIRVDKVAGFSEASRVSAREAPGYQWIQRTLRQLHPTVVVAPGLMVGATDSRHFEGIADDVYRFSPVRAKPEDLKRFHGTNERIAISNLVELIQFYQQLLRNAAQT